MNVDSSIDPPVLIRPIRADDGERLSASHARLSPESRYRRFLSAKPELTGADVRYLVEVDGIDHIALVATQPSLPGEPIVAVARCIRVPSNPDAGEVAIVVADALQGKGVGTRLVSQLAELAVGQGITRFRATMLSENLAIQRLLTGLADGPVTRRYHGETTELELQLPGTQSLAA
ncbi:MAG: GNAT family N-acetyltransferase [Solirubrobacteraceae bacterium]